MLLLADSALVDAMIGSLEPVPDHVFRQALTDEEVKAFEDSVAGAPPAATDTSS